MRWEKWKSFIPTGLLNGMMPVRKVLTLPESFCALKTGKELKNGNSPVPELKAFLWIASSVI